MLTCNGRILSTVSLLGAGLLLVNSKYMWSSSGHCQDLRGGRDSSQPYSGKCVPTKTTPSFQICIHDPKTDIYISKGLMLTGHFDKEIESAIKNISDELDNKSGKEKVFFDVGGNIGVFALYAAKLGFNVHSVEPLIRNLERFMSSIHLNGFKNIRVYPGAVSDTVGPVDLYAWEGNFGSTFIPTGKDDKRLNASSVRYEGSALTFKLNDILKGFKHIDILKIDCEGHEEHVLRGMDAVLKARMVQHIIIELQPNVMQHGEILLKSFKDAGYFISDLISKKSMTYEELGSLVADGKKILLNLHFHF